MRHTSSSLIPVAALLAALGHPVPAAAQTPSVVGHSVDVSRGSASLELQLSNEEVVNITLSGGDVRINGNPVGRYERGGNLDRAWRALLDSGASLNTAALIVAAKRWPALGNADPDRSSQRSMLSAITGMVAVPPATVLTITLPPTPPVAPGVVIAQPAADLPNQELDAQPRAAFAGVGPMVAGLFGSFVALACIAFGLVSFAPRQLGVVSDTVQQSFVRSFFAGLFAQPLILPALATLVLALVLTVVGILAVPFAIIAFAIAVTGGVIGGYIAAARALGEIYLRRRMARGILMSADPAYRAIVVGLMGLLMIWAPYALLGWVPGFGTALLWAAILFTWVMATAGFGATILSRAGLRTGYGRHLTPQLSGELSWSTVDEIAPSKRAGEESIT